MYIIFSIFFNKISNINIIINIYLYFIFNPVFDKMPQSLSLTSAQVNALTTGDSTILYNSQSRDIVLYNGSNLLSTISNLEINNIVGDCLTLVNNSSSTNYTNFTLTETGKLDINVNGGLQQFNIVNHNGSTSGLALNGTLVTSTAAQLNYVDVTPGTASASSALVLDASKNITGIVSLSADTLVGTLSTAAQTGITSVGTLTSLALSGAITGATSVTTDAITIGSTVVTATAAEINTLDGITTTTSEINTLSGVTAGTASASKAVILDSNLDISGINNLSTQNLTVNGTLITASAIELNYTDVATAGTAQAMKSLVTDVNNNISGINSLSATTLAGTLSTAAQTGITSIGTLTGLALSGAITGATSVTTAALTLGSTAVTATAANINVLAGVTAGIGAASKALVLNASSGITTGLTTLSGLTTVSATTLTGTLSTAAQTSITSVGTLTSLALSGAITGSSQILLGTSADTTRTISALNSSMATFSRSYITIGQANTLNNQAEISFYYAGSGLTSNSMGFGLYGGTAMTILGSGYVGIGTVTPSYMLDVTGTSRTTNLILAGTITGVTSITTAALTLGSTAITATAANINVLAGVTAGTGVASKALVLNASSGITTGLVTLSGLTTVSATTLTGTLSTAAQTNITSVGTLSALSVSGTLTLGGTAITATAANINVLAGVSAGTGAASKALVLDANLAISNINYLTATYFYGSIQTAAQTAITSVGTLTSLTLSGAITGATSVSASSFYGTIQTAAQPNITSIGYMSGLSSSFLSIGYNGNSGYPVYINGYVNTNSGRSYYVFNGIISSGGAFDNFSAYFSNCISCHVCFTSSDIRLKENINNLDNEYCKNFILKNKAITYNFKDNKNSKFNGFSAQELIKNGYKDLVTFTEADDENLIETTDSDGFTSMANVKMGLSYNCIVPILSQNIKMLYEDNETLTQQNATLTQDVNTLQTQNATLTQEVNTLQTQNQSILNRLAKLEEFMNSIEITE